MPDDLSDTISEAAQSPESASVDGISIKNPNLKHIIDADRYLSSKTAVQSNPATALTQLKMIHPSP